MLPQKGDNEAMKARFNKAKNSTMPPEEDGEEQPTEATDKKAELYAAFDELKAKLDAYCADEEME